MRKALGSIPSVSTFALVLFLTSCRKTHLSTSSQMAAGRQGVVEAGWVRVGRRRACGSPVFALATCSHHAFFVGRGELTPFSGVTTRITNRCGTVRNARLARSTGRKAPNLVVVGACPPHIQAGGARRRVRVAALVHLLVATGPPCGNRTHDHTLTKRMLPQLASEATETLVVLECTSNCFHCSGCAPPSDLVRESRLRLGTMLLGYRACWSLQSRLAFCARASMAIRIFVLGDFCGKPQNG